MTGKRAVPIIALLLVFPAGAALSLRGGPITGEPGQIVALYVQSGVTPGYVCWLEIADPNVADFRGRPTVASGANPTGFSRCDAFPQYGAWYCATVATENPRKPLIPGDHIRVDILCKKPGKTVLNLRAEDGDMLLDSAQIVVTAEKPHDAQPRVNYSLVVDKQISTRAYSFDCRLRIENYSNALQSVSRPEEKDISLAIKRAGRTWYSVVCAERGFKSLVERGIYLRPKCTIEMPLAKIVLQERGSYRAPSLTPGYYAVTGSWRQPGLAPIREPVFELVETDIPPTTQTPASSDEYPFKVILRPASEPYYQGEPIIVNAQLCNDGPAAVMLMNYFHRPSYRDHFAFEKWFSTTNTKMEDPMRARALIDPEGYEGSIILLPGEFLMVAIDASDEFVLPTKYRVAVSYLHALIIRPQDSGPHYTEQTKWVSNQVDLAISDAPNPAPLANQQGQRGQALQAPTGKPALPEPSFPGQGALSLRGGPIIAQAGQTSTVYVRSAKPGAYVCWLEIVAPNIANYNGPPAFTPGGNPTKFSECHPAPEYGAWYQVFVGSNDSRQPLMPGDHIRVDILCKRQGKTALNLYAEDGETLLDSVPIGVIGFTYSSAALRIALISLVLALVAAVGAWRALIIATRARKRGGPSI